MTPEQEARCNKLYALGLMYNGAEFIYHDINFHWTDIVCMTDEQFNKALEGATKRKAVLDKEQSA